MKILNFDSTIATVSAGTAAAPSISFANDPNTGIYSPGADQLAISTGGTGRLFVDASGRVGVGTSSLTRELILYKNTAPAFHLQNSTSGTSDFDGLGFQLVGADASIVNYENGYLNFFTNSTERLRITSAGLVGIGTASPVTALHVQSSGALATFVGNSANEFIQVSDNNGSTSATFGAIGGGDCYIYSGSGRSTRIYAGTQERARIRADGMFEVKGAGVAGTSPAFSVSGSAPANSAQLDGSGRLLVGTVSALGAAKLETLGNSFVSSAILARINSNDTNPTGFICAKDRAGAIVQSGDQLGAYVFRGYDGSNYVDAAFVRGEVDGTPGANDMPGRLVFSTTADGAAGPTERMRITSTGQVRLAGAGITFNGDTATANELDDYEEGTFTPTVSGGSTAGTGTYSTQAGKYVKIGGMVFAEVALEWSAHTGTGNMFLTGLPFTSAANEAGSGISVGRVSNLAIATNSYLTGYIIASNTAVALRAIPTGGGAESSVTLDTAAAINYSITYMVV